MAGSILTAHAGDPDRVLSLLATDLLDPLDQGAQQAPGRVVDGDLVLALRGRFLESCYAFDIELRGLQPYNHALSQAFHAHRQSDRYRDAREAHLPHLDAWLEIGARDPWIRHAQRPPFDRATFWLYRTSDELAAQACGSYWPIGRGLVAGDLCLLAQTDRHRTAQFLLLRGPEVLDSLTVGPHWMQEAELAQRLRAAASPPRPRTRGARPGRRRAAAPG